MDDDEVVPVEVFVEDGVWICCEAEVGGDWVVGEDWAGGEGKTTIWLGLEGVEVDVGDGGEVGTGAGGVEEAVVGDG